MVVDKEFLSITLDLAEFHTMLLGAELQININHVNITTNNNTPECVICWLSYIEQYNKYIHFIPDKNKSIVKTLSHLD